MNSDTHFLVETDRDDTLDSQSPIKYLNGEMAPRKPIARLKALGKQMKAELINGITAVDIKSNNAKDQKNNSDNETETFNVTEANNDTGSMVIIDN